MIKEAINVISTPCGSVKNAWRIKLIDKNMDPISIDIIIFSISKLYRVYGYIILEIPA